MSHRCHSIRSLAIILLVLSVKLIALSFSSRAGVNGFIFVIHPPFFVVTYLARDWVGFSIVLLEDITRILELFPCGLLVIRITEKQVHGTKEIARTLCKGEVTEQFNWHIGILLFKGTL